MSRAKRLWALEDSRTVAGLILCALATVASSLSFASTAAAVQPGEDIPACAAAVAIGTAPLCFGDCDRDGELTVDEILRVVAMSLGSLPYAACPSADSSRDGDVTVDEIIATTLRSLEGCPQGTGPGPACPDGEEVCEVATSIGLDALSYGKGAAFVDVDGDDLDDIWASDSDQRAGADYGTSILYRNLGDGRFAPFDLGIDEAHLRFNWAGSFGDADNDGDPDLLLVNGGTAGAAKLYFYRNDLRTAGRFTEVTEASGITRDTAGWWGASWADFDADGWLDFVVTSRDRRLWLYRNVAGTGFEDVTVALGVGDQARWDAHNPVWLDYDADGDPDLYVSGLLETFLYRNDGAAGFADVSGAVAVLNSSATGVEVPFVFSAAAEDFNQDGLDDLYLGCWSYQDRVLLNRGDGTFAPLGPEAGLDMVPGDALFDLASGVPFRPEDYENTMGLTVGDIDDDGAPDVLIGTGNPSYRYPDLVFCNATPDGGPLTFRRCGGFVADGHGDSQTHGIALGDADRDGDTDIFYSIGGMSVSGGAPIADGSRSLDAFYRREPADRGTTAVVRLEGTRSNRDAIGATVRVEAGRTRFYTARSTQGFQSQNSSWMVLSLGDAAYGDATVAWPNGAECRIRLFAGERLRVFEVD